MLEKYGIERICNLPALIDILMFEKPFGVFHCGVPGLSRPSSSIGQFLQASAPLRWAAHWHAGTGIHLDSSPAFFGRMPISKKQLCAALIKDDAWSWPSELLARPTNALKYGIEIPASAPIIRTQTINSTNVNPFSFCWDEFLLFTISCSNCNSRILP